MQYGLLGGVILLGAVLRLHGLADKSLWGDEINTAVRFVQKPTWYILTHFDPNNHTLFSLLAHVFSGAGTSEFLLRLPAAMMGIAAIPAVYRLGRAFGSVGVGLIAAFLLAISPYHLFFSREARGYSAMALFSSLSLLYLLRALRSRRKRSLVGFALAAALAVYSHLFTSLLLASELCIVVAYLLKLLLRRETRLEGLAALRAWATTVSLLALVLAILYAPLWLSLLSAIGPAYAGDYAGRLAFRTDWTLSLASVAAQFLRLAGSWTGHWQVPAVLSLGCFGIGLAVGLRRRPWPTLALLFVLAAPFGFIIVLARLIAGFYVYSRFFVYLLPAYLLLAAYGLVSGGRLLAALAGRRLRIVVPGWGLAFMLAVGSIGLLTIPPLRQVSALERQGWRGAGQYLARNTRPGDVIVQLWALQPNSLTWYFDPAPDCVLLMANQLRTAAISPRAGGQVWWIVASLDNQEKVNRLRSSIDSSFEIAVFPWLAVLHWKAGSAGAPDNRTTTAALLDLQGELSPADAALYHALASGVRGGIRPDLARTYLERGDSAAALSDWDTAAWSYQQAVSYWPEWGMAHVRLGNVYRATGRPDDAVAEYRRSIQVEPDYVGAYLNLGGIAEERGQLDEAIGLYEAALVASPNSAWAHVMFGNAILKQGRVVDAIAHLEQAVRLEPGNITWLLALGGAYRSANQSGKAISVYQRVRELEPDNRQAGEALRLLKP